ncbi:Asp-tRNA(Asn)/Glu-tRNA(Gln) amidotransferase subunit GatC [Gephyromycinifex aptenodytis]|uniref:Asp-tRNA(Asn)/Glu-tRNA(Gln) amidotransferase subunit GatC n=1 Tax=Gephyromycinifex aptenodytis TaxID=2716227 RepID=UPI0014488FCF|nr:Asp-tRNA(Asn)/Glu-tRNA(Gln) amidotransferase subunit GatC [Gephyromycinifex aptenodytis]
MPRISRDQVDHLAMLARIDLTDAESEQLVGDLSVILDSLAQVREAAAEDVPAMSHPQPLVNVMRADEARPGLTAEQALAGAPAVEDDRFVVPRILTDD